MTFEAALPMTTGLTIALSLLSVQLCSDAQIVDDICKLFYFAKPMTFITLIVVFFSQR